MQETIIAAKDLRKSYHTGKTEVPVINGINLTLHKGDFTVIMGSSGSGKSTLLYLLSGLEVPTSGELVKNDRKVLNDRARDLMTKMDIIELVDRLPSEVSGGQQQRCSMARAIINNPRVVMADEPTGNLNSASSEAVLNILTELNENEQSIVMVTHEVKSACRANRIIFLKDGQIEDELMFDKSTDIETKEIELLKWLAGKDW